MSTPRKHRGPSARAALALLSFLLAIVLASHGDASPAGGASSGFAAAPPRVTFDPVSGSLFTGTTSTQPLTVRVHVCSDWIVTTSSPTTITWNGSSAAGSFDDGEQPEEPGNCETELVFTGTVTLVEGSNTLSFTITDSQGTTTATATYAYTSGTYQVGVAPDAGSTTFAASPQARTAIFTVSNPGATPVTYTTALACSGVATDCVGPARVAVPAGGSTPVPVSYVGASAGSGRVRLRANVGTLAQDSGWINLTATTPSAAVLSVAADTTLRYPGAGLPQAAVFTLSNTGGAATTATLAATCAGSGVAAPCDPSATSLTLQGGESRMVAVRYTAGSAAGSTGTVTLTANGTTSASLSVLVRAVPSVGAPLLADTLGLVPRAMCLTASIGGGVAYECGDLRLVHPLPATKVLNRDRGLALLYNTAFALPTPAVAVHVTPKTGTSPDSIAAVLTIGATQKASARWAGWGPSEERRIVLSWQETTLTTGVYDYTIQITQRDGGAWSSNGTRTGKLVVVNRRDSPFGRGWWAAGVEELVVPASAPTQRLWVGGDGSAKLYRPASTGVWVAPTLTRPDTLHADTGGAYYRNLPGGARVGYDPTGRHAYTRDRYGHRTWFTWSGGKLTQVRLAGAGGRASSHVYTFEYNASGGRLSRVVAPYVATAGDRNVDLHVNASGEVTKIIDPDGRADSLRYTNALLDRRTDPRNKITDYTYESLNRLVRTRLILAGGDSIAYRFSPAEIKGKQGWPASDLPGVITTVNGPRNEANDVTDISEFTLDRWGAPVRIVGPLGDTTRLVRGDARFPGLVTRTQSPDATETGYQVASVSYDARGRLVATTVYDPLGDGKNATSVHEYGDAAWPDFTTRSTSPSGIVTLTGYDASGNRVWQQLGGDSVRRVRFGYNADGQVTSAWSRAAQVRGEPAQTIEYDTLGNVRAMVSPLGTRTETLRDRIGRDTATLAPIDDAQTEFQETRIRYDAGGRVRETQAIGPAVSIPAHSVMGSGGLGVSVPRSEVWVRNYYTAGVLDSTRRWSTPDTAHIGVMTLRWRYDNASRTVASISADGLRDSTVYNAAGMAVEQHTRRGHVLRMSYDAAGRLLQRVVPGVTYADSLFIASQATTDRAAWVFPRFRPDANGNHTVENVYGGFTAGVTIRADTAVFTYDRAGNLRSADNRDARVRRAYFPGGALKADTQHVRNYASTAFSHTYVIGYQYDLEGRLTRVLHPANVAPTSTTDVEYAYAGATGELASVTDDGGTHAMTYDTEGRLAGLSAYGTTESYAYDADGRNVSERRIRAGLTWKQDSVEYDRRGKQVRVATLQDTVLNAYTGLGALARSIRFDRRTGLGVAPSASEEAYLMDALGNNLRSRQYTHSLTQDAQQTNPRARFDAYQQGTGRLLASGSRYEFQTTTPIVNSEWHAYDAAGNRVTFTDWHTVGYGQVWDGVNPNQAWQVEQSRTYYGADDAVRIVDRRVCAYASATNGGPVACYAPAADARPTFEEHRYDALGRRVLTRTDQSFACGSNCIDGVTRTVWGGDQVLYEIRRPITDPESDTGIVALGTPHPHQYGRVGYTHGGAVDKPLAVYRMDYDTLFPGVHIVAPHTDSRGAFEAGTHSGTGMSMPCRTLARLEADAQGYPVDDADVGGGSGVGDSVQVCVKVDYPAAKQWMSYRPRSTSATGTYAWWGSLISGGRDASGQMYMRNRYYDPASGRFTQEDPIGLAGGLNVYGFAGGDPVNFSDPYGLSPDTVKVMPGAERIAQLCLADEMCRAAYEDADRAPVVVELYHVEEFPAGSGCERGDIGCTVTDPNLPAGTPRWSRSYVLSGAAFERDAAEVRSSMHYETDVVVATRHELDHAVCNARGRSLLACSDKSPYSLWIRSRDSTHRRLRGLWDRYPVRLPSP